MILWNPEFGSSIRGTLFGIDQDGEFDMNESCYIERLEIPYRLSITSAIEMEGKGHQVLLTLSETEIYTFTDSKPLDTISIQGTRHNKAFFRTGQSAESGMTQYTFIDAIMTTPEFQTSELKNLVAYIPYDELNQFGVACLKQLVK
ncbi:MAG: hypothetical protein JWO61_41 [Candidatus Saccharibacteria bacterium]|nr:hypothetical protein [Candidatus Saccharibacteria bacterium]